MYPEWGLDGMVGLGVNSATISDIVRYSRLPDRPASPHSSAAKGNLNLITWVSIEIECNAPGLLGCWVWASLNSPVETVPSTVPVGKL